MMAKGKAAPETVEYTPEVHFSFSKDSKAVPENFGDLQVDGDATVTVKGTIKSIRHDTDTNDRSFAMSFSKVKVKLPNGKPKGVAEAMAEAQEKRQP